LDLQGTHASECLDVMMKALDAHTKILC
jgi:hypothetical protein